jgi:hypothetical protein
MKPYDFRELVKQDNTLINFLDAAAQILGSIEKGRI